MTTKNNKENPEDNIEEKPSNDLVFCFQAIITLNESIKKLDMIGNFVSSNSAGVISTSIGKKIQSLLENQKALEIKFQGLIDEKKKKIDLIQENEIKKLKEDIQKTADELKSSINSIKKTLTEKPDIPKNLIKSITDKEKMTENLDEIKSDLINGSFECFNSIMEYLINSKINIKELRTRETTLFSELRKINHLLKVEEEDFLKESKNLKVKLATNNKELSKAKMESDILYDYRVIIL